MFKRLSNGLLSPKDTSTYYNEKFGKTLLYLLLLVILMLIPYVISISTSSLADPSVRKEIRKVFINEEIPFVIENGELKNVNLDDSYVYCNDSVSGINFYVTENIKNIDAGLNNVNIVLGKDEVYVVVYEFAYPVLKYADYNYLTNIDLSNKEVINSLTFWDNVFGILDEIYSSIKPIIIIVSTIEYFFYWCAWIVILAVILTLFGKIKTGNLLKFSGLFKVSIYNLTPFIFCTIFGTLFGMQLLLYVGYLVSAVYSFISTNKILENIFVGRQGDK